MTNFAHFTGTMLIQDVLNKGVWSNQRCDLVLEEVRHNLNRIPPQHKHKHPLLVVHPDTGKTLSEDVIACLQESGFAIQTHRSVPKGYGYWIGTLEE